MRNYMSYDSSGRLVGIHTHRHAGTGMSGFASDCRLENQNCPNPLSKWFRENVVGKNGVVGFVAYNCPCSPTKQDCTCVNHAYATSRVVDGVLVAKHSIALLVNGDLVEAGTTIKAPPGTKMQVEVVAVGIADGATVDVHQRSTVAITEDPITTLTFSNEKSNAIEVTAPAQGMVGQITFTGLELIASALNVRGWA